MTILFIPQDIFSLQNQGLMVTGKISGGEVKIGMQIMIENAVGQNEAGKITKVEQRKNNPIVGLLITGIGTETFQTKIGQSLEITL